MISVADYFGPHAGCADATDEREENAEALLEKVNALLEEAEAHGVELEMNPATGTLVSGRTFGGFRPQDCPQGRTDSSHKEGMGVDVHDAPGSLDRWVTDAILERHGLYREHPADTVGWSHLTTRAPASGRRTFHP